MHAARLGAGAVTASATFLLIAYMVEGREAGRDRETVRSVSAAATHWLTDLCKNEWSIGL
jgi:hypothetical protein